MGWLETIFNLVLTIGVYGFVAYLFYTALRKIFFKMFPRGKGGFIDE